MCRSVNKRTKCERWMKSYGDASLRTLTIYWFDLYREGLVLVSPQEMVLIPADHPKYLIIALNYLLGSKITYLHSLSYNTFSISLTNFIIFYPLFQDMHLLCQIAHMKNVRKSTVKKGKWNNRIPIINVSLHFLFVAC